MASRLSFGLRTLIKSSQLIEHHQAAPWARTHHGSDDWDEKVAEMTRISEPLSVTEGRHPQTLQELLEIAAVAHPEYSRRQSDGMQG